MLRATRAALDERTRAVAMLRDALLSLTKDSPDCPFCDHGVLRRRVDGRPPFHADDCPHVAATNALAATAAPPAAMPPEVTQP